MSQGQVFKPLLSEAQLDQVREVVGRGFQSPVTIQRKTSTEVEGEDDVVSWTTVAQTSGWLRSTPTPVRVEDSAMVITVNTYRLLLRTDTDIAPGDVVVIGGQSFIVSDTTTESTWKPYLQCSLRRRE